MRRDMEWRTRREGVLEATFPPWLPSHSSRQGFWFNPATGLLDALDYVAEVFGLPKPPPDTPTHWILEHGVTPDGAFYPSRRRAGLPWLSLVVARFEDGRLLDD